MSMTGDRFTLSDEDLFGKILYATDLSKGSQKCIPFLDGLAPTRASLTIAHVEDIRHLEYASMETLRALRGRAEKEVAGLKEHFMQAGFEQVEMVFRRGNAIGELLNLIEQESPSLLVIGATGTYSIAERALGGVAETLIHRAPVHVLLVR
jgi:nucleotide-binding universal stress UspA family protein